jgi:hypothetical protein
VPHESLLLRNALIDYLNTLHRSTGSHEILTPAERGRGAEMVGTIPDDSAQGR